MWEARRAGPARGGLKVGAEGGVAGEAELAGQDDALVLRVSLGGGGVGMEAEDGALPQLDVLP